MKKILSIFWLLVLFFSVSYVFAAELTLTKIGILSTVGVDYSSVIYTGTIPTLEGTATPGATVFIKVKTSTDATVAASPSGVWQFTPGVLDPGTSAIIVSSGEQSLAFLLTFNATPSPTLTATPTPVIDELPEAGVWEYYIPAFGLGIAVLFLGKWVREKMVAWEGSPKK